MDIDEVIENFECLLNAVSEQEVILEKSQFESIERIWNTITFRFKNQIFL